MFQQEFGAHAPAALAGVPKPRSTPLAAALEELREAACDLAFAEAADLIARNRIMMIDGMIAGCEADAAEAGPETAGALCDAVSGLREDRASLAETLSLETAYRDDQRAEARTRIRKAQGRLRSLLQLAERRLDSPPTGIDADDLEDRARESLRFDADELAQIARQEARARLSDGFAASPVYGEQGVPELPHSVAALARRLVEDARGQLF
ncbi:hypothetical protein [Thioclava atlantica]|uniref:Uncharacterized protein n=1 Tax=Thioclava atlantica TaxID=1317124 RepID=A0A085TZF6_9RHOB|nr:hypothetical protein [Thioclava atlantica]KFE36103.1 hypothetical protein DW2_05720 [Thioclava atlantica]